MAKRLNLDDLTFDREPADSKILRIYGATKLCNILFSKELAKKLEPFGELFSLYFYSSVQECVRYSTVEWNAKLIFASN